MNFSNSKKQKERIGVPATTTLLFIHKNLVHMAQIKQVI